MPPLRYLQNPKNIIYAYNVKCKGDKHIYAQAAFSYVRMCIGEEDKFP